MGNVFYHVILTIILRFKKRTCPVLSLNTTWCGIQIIFLLTWKLVFACRELKSNTGFWKKGVFGKERSMVLTICWFRMGLHQWQQMALLLSRFQNTGSSSAWRYTICVCLYDDFLSPPPDSPVNFHPLSFNNCLLQAISPTRLSEVWSLNDLLSPRIQNVSACWTARTSFLMSFIMLLAILKITSCLWSPCRNVKWLIKTAMFCSGHFPARYHWLDLKSWNSVSLSTMRGSDDF